MEIHNIEPVFDKNSKILILGSFPSVKSREQEFFYGHPQNRFWRVISSVFNSVTPKTTDEKKKFLLENNIAVWDVIKSCDIKGSDDNSITNVVPNNLNYILDNANIKQIFINGNKAYTLFNKFYKNTLSAIKLPSTSPANAKYTFEMLCSEWKEKIDLVR